jgi:hypothetical protein
MNKVMGFVLKASTLAGLALGGTIQPVLAAECWTPAAIESAKLRQLDVMLLVSALRCRSGPDDFKADYESFLEQHRPLLSKANHVILDDMTPRIGAMGALNALDRMSVVIANHYGERGAFGCHELKAVTQELARGGDEDIPAAADMLVGADVLAAACPMQLAARK